MKGGSVAAYRMVGVAPKQEGVVARLRRKWYDSIRWDPVYLVNSEPEAKMAASITGAYPVPSLEP